MDLRDFWYRPATSFSGGVEYIGLVWVGRRGAGGPCAISREDCVRSVLYMVGLCCEKFYTRGELERRGNAETVAVGDDSPRLLCVWARACEV
jgi:hypothetical protein